MAKRQVWTVRVVNYNTVPIQDYSKWGNHLPGVWVEQLRYMGHAKELASYGDRNVIELYCPEPTKHDTKIWAEQNAGRMRSFGIDAAAAPQWADDRNSPDNRINVTAEHHMERFNRPKVTR